jgi:hypothetical protein
MKVSAEMDWALLREQKAWLVSHANEMVGSDLYTPEEVAYADGLINLIDSIQDCAVIDGDATDVEVFGEEVIIITI